MNARARALSFSTSDLGPLQSKALADVAQLLREVPEGDGRWIGTAVGAFRVVADGARPLQARKPG